MYVKMDKIDIYNDSAIVLNKKMPKSIISWITILLLLFILLVIFFSIPFNTYKNYIGYVKVDNLNSYLIISPKKSDFPINKSNKLYIKSDEYDYEVTSINEDNVILKVDLKEEIKIENNIVLVNLLSSRTTVFEILKNKLRKGFGL